MSTKRVYVTSPSGIRVAGYGSRESGEFFEVSEKEARALATIDGLTLESPSKTTAKTPPKKDAGDTKAPEKDKEGN